MDDFTNIMNIHCAKICIIAIYAIPDNIQQNYHRLTTIPN